MAGCAQTRRSRGISRRAKGAPVLHKEGLGCLDVSRYRGTGAFPGGPRAHLVLRAEAVHALRAEATQVLGHRVPQYRLHDGHAALGLHLGEGAGAGEGEGRGAWVRVRMRGGAHCEAA